MWKTIDTAPKDGTEVLGYDPQGKHMEQVAYSDDYQWWGCTHWMPLPDKPLAINKP